MVTEKDLRTKYGPVYDKLFRKPATNEEELVAREELIKDYLKDHPSEIFETGNNSTIRRFVKFFKTNTRKLKNTTIRKYNELKSAWEMY